MIKVEIYLDAKGWRLTLCIIFKVKTFFFRSSTRISRAAQLTFYHAL